VSRADDPSTDASFGSEVPSSDLTGRDRMVANVLASWAGHFVFVVAGFVLPRMIDSFAGQEALGVWDFSWSLVAYFILVQGGIVSSINRYVARYRATGDMESVNRAVSSVSFVLAVMALVIVALSVATALWLPDFFGNRLGSHQSDAQWVVFLLGSSLAVQILFSGFGGVVTGCHRWGLHNAILAGTHLVTITGMIVLLLSGGGLTELAAMNLLGEIGGRTVRTFVAYRVCPGLRVRPSLASWTEARSMLRFGGKSFVPDVAELLLNQTTNILVLAYLGPAALAIYSRPRALIRHVTTLVSKLAFVLTPTASSLQATGRGEEIRGLLTSASRWAGYLTIPMILTLAVLGGPLLRLWMGRTYANEGALVLTVLALGNLALIIQTTVRGVLTGLDAHGRVGLANLVASLLAVVLTVVALGPLHAGLVAVALAVTVPLTIANVVYIPLYACRKLGLPLRRYWVDTLRGPVLCAIPFAFCLLGARMVFEGQPVVSLVSGACAGGATLAFLYWRYVLPSSYRTRLQERLFRHRTLKAEGSL